MSRECLDAVIGEIESCGLTARVEHGGKHPRVFFPARLGEQFYVLANSASDYRTVLNCRADVRRLLRDSGYSPDNVIDLPRLTVVGGDPVCNSVDVAGHFGKAHKNILAVIHTLSSDLGEDFNRLNFKPINYTDDRGRVQRCFELSRDAFSLLVMGFTGAAALKWKMAYIKAFNAMERELRAVTAPADLVARIEKLEGELAALVDLCIAPKVDDGFVFIRGHVRRKRLSA